MFLEEWTAFDICIKLYIILLIILQFQWYRFRKQMSGSSSKLYIFCSSKRLVISAGVEISVTSVGTELLSVKSRFVFIFLTKTIDHYKITLPSSSHLINPSLFIEGEIFLLIANHWNVQFPWVANLQTSPWRLESNPLLQTPLLARVCARPQPLEELRWNNGW